jgi:cancer susceptibility candidate protein 1
MKLRRLQADECICRISEVRDWELGGRTALADAKRIFDKELASGPARVMVLIRRGQKGVAFSRAFNRCAAYPELLAYDDERCNKCIWGEVHCSVMNLLKGDFAAELVDEEVLDIQQREGAELKRRQGEAKRWVRYLVSCRTCES